MTLDMTNNRVPYGLLTDEEKAALHEHEKAGGEFEFEYWCGTWEQIKPSWIFSMVYRTVPLPKTQDVRCRSGQWIGKTASSGGHGDE
jgi:hypothetical protein